MVWYQGLSIILSISPRMSLQQVHNESIVVQYTSSTAAFSPEFGGVNLQRHDKTSDFRDLGKSSI